MFEGMGKEQESKDVAPPRRKTFSDLPWMGSMSQQGLTVYVWLFPDLNIKSFEIHVNIYNLY